MEESNFGTEKFINKNCWLVSNLGRQIYSRCKYCQVAWRKCYYGPKFLFPALLIPLFFFLTAIVLGIKVEKNLWGILTIFYLINFAIYSYLFNKGADEVTEATYKVGKSETAIEKLKIALEKKLEETNAELYQKNKELEKALAEIKISQHELREAEKKYRLLVENSPIGIMLLDREGKIIYENPALAEMMGVPKGTISKAMGKKVAELPGIVAAGMAEKISAPLKGEKIENVPFSYASLYGKKSILEVSGYPLIEEEGKVQGAFYLISDITKQAQVQEDLKNSYAQLLAIFNSIEEAIYVVDPSTYEVLYANKALTKVFGEVEGKKCYEVFQNLDAPCDFCTNKYIFGENLGKTYVWEFQNKANQRWYRCYDQAIKWPNGRWVRYEMAFDITESKLASNLLKKRLSYEKLLSEISSLTLTIKDIDEFQKNTLKLMAKVLNVSRIYIFEYRSETDTADNTFEWVAPGIAPQKENLQGIPASAIPWWMEMMKSNKVINYKNIEDIPGEREKEILRAQQIKSILVVPLFVAGKPYGFMGFDECREYREWPQEDVEILRSIAHIVEGEIERWQIDQELKKRLEELEKMNKFMVGRELDMIELKKEVNRLLAELGREAKYKT